MLTLTTGNRLCGAGIHHKCHTEAEGFLACDCCCHSDEGIGFDFEHRSTTIQGEFHEDIVAHLAATEGERCAAFGGEYVGSCGAEQVFAEIGLPDVAGLDVWERAEGPEFRFCSECLRHMFRAAAMGWSAMTGEALPPPCRREPTEDPLEGHMIVDFLGGPEGVEPIRAVCSCGAMGQPFPTVDEAADWLSDTVAAHNC